MFDGIKILNVAADAQRLEKLLEFRHVVRNSGEIERSFADYSGLTFSLMPGSIRLSGSLHKFKNAGCHNADAFTAVEVCGVVDTLSSALEINPHKSILNNLEFGVNLSLDFPPKSFLSRLLAHKGAPFQMFRENGKLYYQCQHEQFILKAYDKGLQYGLKENVLRFEVKALKMQSLERAGITIRTLADLKDPRHYDKLGHLLVKYFSEIITDDETINMSKIPVQNRVLCQNGRNARYWQKPERPGYVSQSEYEAARKRQQREEKRFREIVTKYGDGKRLCIENLIYQQWDSLTRG